MSLSVRFKLTDAAQAGNAAGLQRCAAGQGDGVGLGLRRGWAAAAAGISPAAWRVPGLVHPGACGTMPSRPRPRSLHHARRAKAMRHSLAKPASQWYVLKLSSMSTIMREWAAIHCIAHMPLREVLLTAKASEAAAAAALRGCGFGDLAGRCGKPARIAAGGWCMPCHALAHVRLREAAATTPWPAGTC